MTVGPPDRQTARPSDRPPVRHWLLPLTLFSILWLDLIRLLSSQWEAREQYAYGWFVPIFALGLFWRRWLDRPAVGPPDCQTVRPSDCQTAGPSDRPTVRPSSVVRHLSSERVLWSLTLLILLALLPLRVIYEINPDWPLPSWAMALAVVTITLYAVFLMGGLQWVRHFAFPICFILIAVAWPYRIEHTLTQGLMRVVSGLTVEVLGWCSIPAFQRGNLIEVSTGVVGVDEACSGIRSFQATLMGALFLGELYRLNLLRRSFLLAGGVLLSFGLNVIRTFFLTSQASSQGVGAIDKWHDSAGMTIFLISFACLWALSGFLKRKGSTELCTQTPEHGRTASVEIAALPASSSPQSDRPPTSVLRPLSSGIPMWSSGPLVRRYLAAVGCWTLIVLGLTEAWYRVNEASAAGGFQWRVSFPTNETRYAEIEFTDQLNKNLRHDEGGGCKWQEPDGTSWSLYFLRWNPTSIDKIISARLHRPEVCLPGAGLRLVEDAGTERIDVHNIQLPFRKYTYQSHGQILHVFFCQWEDGLEEQSGIWGGATRHGERFRTVLVGRRKLGQQTFELILTGHPSMDSATEAVRQRLPSLIQVEPSHPKTVAVGFAPDIKD